MRIIQITNWHRYGGGSDYIAKTTARVLRDKGHDVELMGHDSGAFQSSFRGKVEAFCRGVYSRRACNEMAAAIQEFKPDVVHVHELYPYHSPWVLQVCHKAGVPTVMTCHDFRMTCPIATHMRKGQDCDLCANGANHWCLVHNCRGSYMESAAYAARSTVADVAGLFARCVSIYITPSHYLRRHLVRAGFDPDRVTVVENMVESVAHPVGDPGQGAYAAYAGRIAPEKSIELLLEACAKTGIPLRVAGGDPSPELRSRYNGAVTWVGNLYPADLAAFYQGARFVVVPSRWREVFGLVAAEAMMHGLPLIASKSGALPELIKDQATGLLFSPGDVDHLAECMQSLWSSPDQCRHLGRAGRQRALQRYTTDQHYDRLLRVYERVVTRNPISFVASRSASFNGVGVA